MKVLFVCLGNICRSPSAEGIFKAIVREYGLESDIYIDSAGTSAYHVGEKADSRMIKAAKARGYLLTSLSRKLLYKDLSIFDYIIAMDEENYNDILLLDRSEQYKQKVSMVTDFSKNYLYQDVPDPYYGGDDGFNRVIDILEESLEGFLEFIQDGQHALLKSIP